VRGTTTVAARRYDTFQVVATSLRAESGKRYLACLVSTYPKQLNMFAWAIPGWTTCSTSLVVTTAFTIMLLIPVRRLQRAASQIAGGNMRARVQITKTSVLTLEDDMRLLMLDFNGMASRLETLVDSQKLLLRDVSHELRSPLARLGIALEMARLQTKGEVLIHLSRIERESIRLNNLIGQLLSLSDGDKPR
jgi:signal transduction histidine kinase